MRLRARVADHRQYRQPEHQPFGTCRWCRQPITKPDGQPDRRRNWHPACVDAYLLGRKPLEARRMLFQRDRGVCAVCGFDHVAQLLDTLRANGDASEYWRRAAAGLTRQPMSANTARIFAFQMGDRWAADHIVALIDGGSFELTNLQTLCIGCHKDKTAAETAVRAAKRRAQSAA